VSDAPPVGPLPATTNGYVTFASINNFNKITPAVLNTWAAILRRVPDSRLLVRADMTDSVRDYLITTLASCDISAARLELVNRLPHHEYLQLIDRVDIALDPFPFNGHTTTCDCLWQGVPVVTLSGTSYASRFGGSGLVTLGLEDLIAHTPDEYIEIAARLAGDRKRLAGLRAGLRPQMAASPLMDFTGFTRKLEAEYRRMWDAWCESRGPT
jgi:predicted O-linked N-acetylglucosamine transferase (SPINDLY family)